MYKECVNFIKPKLANIKKREERKFQHLQKKIKMVENTVAAFNELEQQLEELRNEMTDTFEEQQVSIWYEWLYRYPISGCVYML